MENITFNQLAEIAGTLTVLAGFCFGIYKFIKKVALDKIEKNSKDIEKLNYEVGRLKSEIEDSKEERLILIKGLLACLKGLKEQGCDGAVTDSINDIENYLMKKTHN